MTFICIICRDSLSGENQGRQNASSRGNTQEILVVTSCGHLYHRACLLQAFAIASQAVYRRNACPTCNTIVNPNNLLRFYPSENDGEDDIRSRREIERLTAELVQANTTNQRLEDMILEISNLTTTAAAPAEAVGRTGTTGNGSPTNPSSTTSNSTIVIVEKNTTSGGLVKGDNIVWLGESPHNGVVKWLGSINQLDYAGIEFEDPIGNNFPEAGGQRLFSFKRGHGRLLPVRELILYSDLYETTIQIDD